MRFTRLSAGRELPVFAVGAATARAAREAGFASVRSAHGDVKALARLLSHLAPGLRGEVIHAGPVEAAGDLAADLSRRGVPARAVAIYETVAADLPSDFLDGITDLGAVLVHSPRAGGRVAELLAGLSAPGLAAYCLSPAVSATLEGLDIGPVIAAPLPSEDALLSLLTERRRERRHDHRA